MANQQGLNQVVIVGNLAVEPNKKGESLILKLAVVGREKVGEEWKEKTTWVNVLISGKRASSLAPLLKEGDRLVVHGEIRNGKNADYVAAREVLLAGGGKKKAAAENSSSSSDDIGF